MRIFLLHGNFLNLAPLAHNVNTRRQIVYVLSNDHEDRSLCELVHNGIRLIGVAITWRKR